MTKAGSSKFLKDKSIGKHETQRRKSTYKDAKRALWARLQTATEWTPLNIVEAFGRVFDLSAHERTAGALLKLKELIATNDASVEAMQAAAQHAWMALDELYRMNMAQPSDLARGWLFDNKCFENLVPYLKLVQWGCSQQISDMLGIHHALGTADAPSVALSFLLRPSDQHDHFRSRAECDKAQERELINAFEATAEAQRGLTGSDEWNEWIFIPGPPGSPQVDPVPPKLRDSGACWYLRRGYRVADVEEILKRWAHADPDDLVPWEDPPIAPPVEDLDALLGHPPADDGAY